MNVCTQAGLILPLAETVGKDSVGKIPLIIVIIKRRIISSIYD